MLHTVNKSPFEKGSLTACLRYARDGDAVLLYEDGVYAARAKAAFAGDVEAATKRLRIFVLGPDMAARGLAAEQIIDGIEVVDYDGFVDLAAEQGPVQAWL